MVVDNYDKSRYCLLPNENMRGRIPVYIGKTALDNGDLEIATSFLPGNAGIVVPRQ